MPVELNALQGRHQDRIRRDFFRSGTIAAAIYNVNRDPVKTPFFKASDIFPGLAEPQKKPTPEDEAAALEFYFGSIIAEHARRKDVNG
jgi:hypothetical protein